MYGISMMAEGGIAPPPTIVSSINTDIVLAVFAVAAALAAIVAVRLAIAHRDALPVAVCVGSLVCALNEPIYDILGKIVYASNNPMAYVAFGRAVPWFLVLGYVPWVGLAPYLIAGWIESGVPRARLHWLAAGSMLSVVVIETLGNLTQTWGYYGVPPLKYLVVAPQMAPVPIVGGVLLYALAWPLSGWRRAVVGFAISTLALPMVFASASWPLYFGLYVDLPVPVRWAAGVLMLLFTTGMVVGATSIGYRLRRTETRAPMPGPAPSAAAPATTS
jgi:hypothetical protein